MNLLAAKLYDPSSAVSKSCASLLALTAFDTTNLRLAITVPAHGMVRFRLQASLSGATTFPQVLLGVLNGAAVVGRQVPMASIPGTALATTNVPLIADFIATGLTPGAMNVDAAYGVETILAATNIHYGGPNNTTANDAWGAFSFEAWDPQPLKAALDGGVNVTQYGGVAGTFSGGRPEVNTSHAAGTAWGSGAITAASIAADAITAAKIANGAIDAATFAAGAIDATAIADNAIDAATLATGTITAAKFAAGAIDAAAIATDAIGAAEFAQGAADKVWASAARVLTAGTNIVLAKGVGVTGFTDLDAAAVRTAVGLASANLDTQLAALATLIDGTAVPGSSMNLTAGAVDAILDEVVEGAITMRQLLRLYAAALLGKASGMDTGSVKFRDTGDTKDRIAATTDATGNRLSVTLDAS